MGRGVPGSRPSRVAVRCGLEQVTFPPLLSTALMEIKGFSQCIAANKQQACGLAAAASCGMVAACEFFLCKLVLLLLVAATLRNHAANCLLQPCGLCVFRMQIRFLALSCSLFAANSCSLFAANSC